MIQRCKTYFHIGHTLRQMHFYGELGCTKKFTTENSRKLFGIEVEAWALLQHFTSRLFLEAVIIKFFFLCLLCSTFTTLGRTSPHTVALQKSAEIFTRMRTHVDHLHLLSTISFLISSRFIMSSMMDINRSITIMSLTYWST